MLAPWIISHFPEHNVYVEPFGGAGSVLLRKPRCYAEVYNDRWDVVVNVFRVMRDPESNVRLKELLINTPFARTEFENCSLKDIVCPIERARRTIFRSFSGFGSAAVDPEYNTGFRANSNRSGTTPSHDWVNYPTHLDFFLDRLRGVIIENRNAFDLIPQQDSEKALFYVDPPYVHDSRSSKTNYEYAYEMTDAEHIELALVLSKVKGMVVLSGYNSSLYEILYGHWKSIERAALSDGAHPRIERLWFNAAAWRALGR